MSGPGPGYGRGPAQPQGQQYHGHQQQPYGSSGGAQHDYDPASHYGATEQRPFETLYEQDEPVSPEMNRQNEQQHWGGQAATGGGGGGGDPYGNQGYAHYDQQNSYGGYGQQEGYDPAAYQQSAAAPSEAGSQYPEQQQQFDAPYYPGWIYDAASNSYLPDPGYQGEGAEAGEEQGHAQEQQHAQQYDAAPSQNYDAAGAHLAGQDATSDPYNGQQYGSQGAEYGSQANEGAPPDQSQFEPPHYPGWIYDSASNSYLPDPNFQGEGEGEGGDANADTLNQGAEAQQGSQYVAQNDQQDPYGPHAGQDSAAASQDPYAADSNPYANEEQQSDPFAQEGEGQDSYSHGANVDPYAAQHEQAAYGHDSQYGAYGQQDSQHDAYGQQEQQQSNYGQDSHDPYRHSEASQDRSRGHAEPQRQTASLQASYDPYAPAPASSSAQQPQATPASPNLAQNGYSPAPAQQQFTSFAAAYDTPAAQGQSRPSHDPYAPTSVQQQQQQSRPLPPQQQPRQVQAAPPPQHREPGRARATSDAYAASIESNDDPYAPRQARSPATRRPTVSRPAAALSPSLTGSPAMGALDATSESLPTAAPPARVSPAAPSSGPAPPPPRASPAPAGPPPRSGQANIPAPPRSVASVAASSPQSETGLSVASPSPRPAQLPPPQKQQQLAPSPSAGAAFDIPPLRQSTDGRGGGASRQNRAQQQNVPAAASAPQDSQQGPPRRNGYAPPPTTAAAPRDAYAPSTQPAAQPPPQRKPVTGGLQPPARRAPHQRGASAFAGDSPYGAPPQGPPTSAYEPPESVEEIKEEDEEDEVPEPKAEPEQPEEYMPSWMQATATGPSQQGAPYSPPAQNQARPRPNERVAPNTGAISPQIEQGPPPPRSLRGPPKLDGADSLTAGMQGMSLGDRKSPVGPPPPRAANQQGPPPRQAAAPPPPRGPASSTGAPPPTTRSADTAQSQSHRGGPMSPRDDAPSFQQQQQQQRRPSATSQPPPPPPQQQQYQSQSQQQQYASGHQQDQRYNVPATPDRNAVPQLHFEAPSPNEPPSADSRAADRAERYGYASNGRTTPVPMAGIEETPEPQEHEQSDYFGGSGAPQYASVSEDGQMTGPTTPSSHYGGDWKADSQQHGGYDYIKQEHQFDEQQQDPYAPQPSGRAQDAYAPQRDYPQREGSRTPSAPQPPRTQYASPPSRAQPSRPGARKPPTSQQQAQSPADAYSPYAPQAGQYGQETHQHEDQKPYDPYGARTAAASSEAQPIADLGLERRTAPVVSFGFGGRVVLVFPQGGQRSYGVDAANPYGTPAATQAQSTPSTVHVRKLDELVPSVQDGAPFPGPIFLDGGKSNASKKRKEALSWLSQRTGELEQEISYARGPGPTGYGSEHAAERRAKVESRLLLVKLLKVMLENEGKIVGSPQIDDAIRAIMSPGHAAGAADVTALPTADQLANAATSRPAGSASPFVTYGVAAADLDQMTSYLLQGDRREAVRYAVEHSMWAHAFIIASCVDTDCWKDVTNEFLQAELTPSSDHTGPGAEGREALRVAYGMFAGLGDESIQQLIPPQALGPDGQAQGSSSPMSRTGSRSAGQDRMPQQALDKWQETVGMIVANRTAGDSAALTSLGDALLANGRIDAAHVCYLLSPQTSFAGGLGMPNSRIILLGSIPFASETAIDLESVKLTELLEYALSLVPVLKGHEPFVGLPHLQAFRLYHAATLADAGDISRAHKYTEAIVNTLKLATKPSPFYHPRLLAQIKTLTERLGSAPGQKETGSWLTRKVPRPTVNSLWSTFEGGFNKFVAGEGEPTPQQLAAKAEVAQQTNGAAVGAFSHFSSIAPDSTGGLISRAHSTTDLPSSDYLQPALPARPSSATRPTSPLAAPAISPPVANPQHHQSPGPPPVKRASFKTHHARSSSLGAFAGYDYSPAAPPPWQSYTPPSLPGRTRSNDGQDGPPTSPRGPPSARRPQFAPVEERLREDESGFISPMAHLTPSVSPSPASGRQNADQSQTHRRMTTAEELADLGIGNSKSKKPAFDTLEEELEAEEGGMPVAPKKEPESAAGATLGNDSKPDVPGGSKPGEKPTIKPSKSWLGGWFKREASPANTPGPVRANLGEQSGFHYDKNLGRWVNKAGKGMDEAPSPVIPPPRASTASPSRAMRSEPSRFMSEAPPPVPPMPTRSQTGPLPPLSRSATMADLRSDGRPPSALSNPTRPPSATGLPPRMGGTPTEGLSRPSSGRGKKPKYVVVPP